MIKRIFLSLMLITSFSTTRGMEIPPPDQTHTYATLLPGGRQAIVIHVNGQQVTVAGYQKVNEEDKDTTYSNVNKHTPQNNYKCRFTPNY